MSVVIAILVFGVIVLIHEIGHYAAAVKCGITVEEFAIGMGPRLFGVKRKDTVYSLRLLPIGGFCKMLDENSAETGEGSYPNAKVHMRIIVISAGAVMNFLLAFILFFVIVSISRIDLPVVKSVLGGAPAAKAGLRENDRIISIDGSGVNIYEDLLFALSTNQGQEITVVYRRDGQKRETRLTPYLNEVTGSYMMGVSIESKAGVFAGDAGEMPKAGFFECASNAYHKILFYIKSTVLGLMRVITRKIAVTELAGPIGVVGIINEEYAHAAAHSAFAVFFSMLNLCAVLSANLGVFNLLPLPALDGGRLVFLFIEAARGKPLNPEREGLIHVAGFALLLLLAVFIAYNDIRGLL